MRQVKADRLRSLTLIKGENVNVGEELFVWTDKSVTFSPGIDPTEPPPSLSTASGEDIGLEAMVVISGHADAAHLRGTLGQRVRQGVGLFPKKLGRARGMNVLWASDEVRTWVRERGRLGNLSPLNASQRERCRDWAEREEREEPTQDSGEDGTLQEGEAHCGLMDDVSPLAEILERTEFEGYYPHLFDLDTPLCGQPEHERTRGGLRRVNEEENVTEEREPSAFEIALKTLVVDGDPQGERVLVLLGDGQDGYLYPAGECRAFVQERCNKDNATWSARKSCMEKSESRFVVASQERFRNRLGPWLALARASGVRIFSVIHPGAPDHGRERMEILAVRTGGTARVAEDANEVVDLYNDLIDELEGQHVLTFMDPEVEAGDEVSYLLRARAGTSVFTSGAWTGIPPESPEGLAALQEADPGGMRTALESRLGPTGAMVVIGVLALLLALLAFKLLKGGARLLIGGVSRLRRRP